MFSKVSRSSLMAAALLAPVAAFAGSIKIDFTVTSTSAYDSAYNSVSSYDGYGIGSSGSGSFTFDDSVGNFTDSVAGRPISEFSFNWLGQTWGDGSALLSRMSFDASGNVSGWGIGSPLSCGIDCISLPGPTDFWIISFASGAPQSSIAAQHNDGAGGYALGSVSWTATKVPEPGTLALLALGFAAIFVLRRNRAGASRV